MALILMKYQIKEVADGCVIMMKIMLLLRMNRRMMIYVGKEGLRLSGTVIMCEMDRTLAPTLAFAGNTGELLL